MGQGAHIPPRVFGAEGGIPALALHCSLAHSGAWKGLAAHLPDLRITASDMPGHGSAAPCDPTRNQHEVAAAEAIALLRADGRRHHLIGHSFGAVTALLIAQRAPQMVQSVVLFEPVLFCAARPLSVFSAYLKSWEAVEAALAAADTHRAAALFHATWGHGQDFADLPEATQAYFAARIHLIRAQNVTLFEDAPGLLTQGRLEALTMPVLIAEGADSPSVIAAINTELARRLPNASRAVVAGAGHMLPITHSRDCAGIVQNFLLSEAAVQA